MWCHHPQPYGYQADPSMIPKRISFLLGAAAHRWVLGCAGRVRRGAEGQVKMNPPIWMVKPCRTSLYRFFVLSRVYIQDHPMGLGWSIPYTSLPLSCPGWAPIGWSRINALIWIALLRVFTIFTSTRPSDAAVQRLARKRRPRSDRRWKRSWRRI